MRRLFGLILFLLWAIQPVWAERAHYEYQDRTHTWQETTKYVSIMYGITWGAYFVSQPDFIRDHGSMENYRHNFGRVVFDMDSDFWNLFVHPLTGSQMFLFYRANGYTRLNSFLLTSLSSALFEFTVEIYTEPPSAQDLYHTPVFGSMLGVVLEESSLYLLNRDQMYLRVLGHIINPWSLFPFFEGKRGYMKPEVQDGKLAGLSLGTEF